MSKNNPIKPSKSSSKKSKKGKKTHKFLLHLVLFLAVAGVLAVVSYFAKDVYLVANDPVRSEQKVNMPSAKPSPKIKKEEPKAKRKELGKVEKKEPTAKSKVPTKSEGSPKDARKSAPSVKNLRTLSPERDLLPSPKMPFASQVIAHIGYVVSYNADFKVPNWVLYELNYAETLGNIPRKNSFAVDPEVPDSVMAQLTDYRNSGYDRGHMAPNADLNWNAKAQEESFYLSNMCPQGHDFNAGIWLDLESQVRRWAERDSAVTIVCGPVLPRSVAEASSMKKIGKGHVLVPEYFYKIVFSPFGKQPQAIGFIMPNRNEKVGRKDKPLSSYVVTVDSIERVTGIDFFPILTDDVEEKIESSYNLKYWFQ